MKRSFLFTVLVMFIIIISSSRASVRFLVNKQGEEEVELSEITDIELMNLMGMKACDVGDDGCLKRRMMSESEAHLDYIYTQGQHHKP
ncbi:hypothetical protein V6N13_018980 [Hibiscus sabdariffa]|uniref:Phytosulfokine n=1 Tax=Hibiscus sabdariffa TaxID=183260 RepID=A0ABR2EKA6_9ROSI